MGMSSLDIEGTLSEALTKALHDTETTGGWWGHPECEEFARLVTPPVAAVLREQIEGTLAEAEARLLDAREALRVHMLNQPSTDGRDTYSDGYGQGIATAIGHIDRVLGKEALTRPRAAHLSDTERAGGAE